MLSIVIPAYNEEVRIGKAIDTAERYCDEVIVVDDGSKDNTYNIAKKKGARTFKNNRNRGKGYSVRKGLLNAEGDHILFMDSDLATPMKELKKMMEYINDYDIVIASRNMKESKINVKQPFYRRILGNIFPLLVNLIAVRGIKDTQCGFKLYSKEAAKAIAKEQKTDGFAFDVEHLLIAKRKGFSIKEVPVEWNDKGGSKVSPVKDSIKMLKELLRIRFS